jgi:hypothetical protein
MNSLAHLTPNTKNLWELAYMTATENRKEGTEKVLTAENSLSRMTEKGKVSRRRTNFWTVSRSKDKNVDSPHG